MKKQNRDYLKYWRVIRYYVKKKYDISQDNLEIILFLSSEGYFKRGKFDEYNNLLRWNKDRFTDMVRQGWIELFRRRVAHHASLYQLTDKSKRVIKFVYDKLDGKEVAQTARRNPMFRHNVSYTDRIYREEIIKMNESIQQQRRPAPESPYSDSPQ